jgi:hypothetical protein
MSAAEALYDQHDAPRPTHITRLRVRIIEARLDVHGADGTRLGDSYR